MVCPRVGIASSLQKHFSALPRDNLRLGKSQRVPGQDPGPGDLLAGKCMVGLSLAQFTWLEGVSDGVSCVFYLVKYLRSAARA